MCVTKVAVMHTAVCHYEYQILLQKFAIRVGRCEETTARWLYRLSKVNI